MPRRDEALQILEEWWNRENTAKALEREAILPITRAAMRQEADDLKEQLLMLMGVDDTPAAMLELSEGPNAS